MSTRGYLGIKKNGELKGQYNHFDSYVVGGLGEELSKIIQNIKKEDRLRILNETFDFIELVDEDSIPTQEQVDYCVEKNICDLNVGSKDLADWYCLLRGVQGNLKSYMNKECKYMLNGNKFLDDNIWCEYGYVINLDTNEFEIYEFGHNLVYKCDLLKINTKKIIDYFKNKEED